MKKAIKRMLSFVLVVCFLLTPNGSVFAAAQEYYLSELRLVYANSYQEAKEILEGSEFKDYRLFRENLNADTGKTGTWLAYKVTTDIEDAITDLAVMQMCGGYQEGNYQQMIQESYNEYLDMGRIYLQAIEYFNQAYDQGYFPAEAAFRQLNFYNVVSTGVPANKIPSFEGELLGDIFYNGISEQELATMFFQGNVHVLTNVRSLLAMGVSYNQDGKTYLDKVEEEAARVLADPNVYSNQDYDELAKLIAPTVGILQDKLKELCAYEAELNYTDDDLTQTELDWAETKAIADMLRDVDYLGGKSLYQFCLDFDPAQADLRPLYPLAAALNPGQEAMTKVAHYYDVVRYSVPFYPEEVINQELDRQEAIYGPEPFNVYSGVDRTIYEGTFALTNEAYRADVYGEGGFSDALFGGDRWKQTAVNLTVGAVGAGIFVGAIVQRVRENAAISPAAIEAAEKATAGLRSALDEVAKLKFTLPRGATMYIKMSYGYAPISTYGDALDMLLAKHQLMSPYGIGQTSVFDKFQILMKESLRVELPREDMEVIRFMGNRIKERTGEYTSFEAYQETVKAATPTHLASGLLFFAGGVLLLVSVFRMGMTVVNYYYPSYEDVPVALVDVKNTADGDRYIKYDAVYEAQVRKNGAYAAGDLNGFEGQRWNALYYTKSYEAGKPLLADEFSLSSTNNQPKAGYTPVHRFGEVVCYDMNKYTYNDNTSVYLSVKQSKNDKAAVAGVPELVGSIFANGLWLLVSGVGAVLGVGATLGTQKRCQKKRSKKTEA